MSPPPGPEPQPDLDLIGCRGCSRTGADALRSHVHGEDVLTGLLIFAAFVVLGLAVCLH